MLNVDAHSRLGRTRQQGSTWYSAGNGQVKPNLTSPLPDDAFHLKLVFGVALVRWSLPDRRPCLLVSLRIPF